MSSTCLGELSLHDVALTLALTGVFWYLWVRPFKKALFHSTLDTSSGEIYLDEQIISFTYLPLRESLPRSPTNPLSS